MAKFNADSFLQQTVEAKLDTKRVPHPEGDWDEGQIKDLKITSGTAKESGKLWVRLQAIIINTDPNVAADMKLGDDQEPQVRWEEFLDLDDNGNLDVSEGKNIKLGKLRQACGQNSDEAWSPMDMKGAPVGFRVKHQFNNDGDPYAVCSGVYNPAGDDEDEE
jgi:hypothetical protein